MKFFGQKSGGKGTFLFLSLSRMAGLIFFVATAEKLVFVPEIIPYALVFGALYSICVVSNFYAISCGPLSLSSLITSYSLMLPTAYGLVFLHDPMSISFIIGIVLLLISLFLINKKTDKTQVAITARWALLIFITFIANGGCSVAQSVQQQKFDGAFKSELMIIAFAIFIVVTLIFAFICDRKDIVKSTKMGLLPAVVCGVANAVVNLLTMVLQGVMPVSVVFPLISGGSLILTYFVSRFVYKEKLSPVQLSGFLIGTISVVFLNL